MTDQIKQQSDALAKNASMKYHEISEQEYQLSSGTQADVDCLANFMSKHLHLHELLALEAVARKSAPKMVATSTGNACQCNDCKLLQAIEDLDAARKESK